MKGEGPADGEEEGAIAVEVQDLIRRIKDCPPVQGVCEILLPGENAHRHYVERVERGLDVDEVAWQQIVELAGVLGVATPKPLSNP